MKKILKLVLACLLVLTAGCSTTNPTDDSTPSVNEVTTDVVVVGAGASGLNAAVFAAEKGADVIIVEKLGVIGGSALVSSGALLTANGNGLFEGDDSLETALNVFKTTAELSDKNSGYPDYDRLSYMLERTGETVNRLKEMGVPFAAFMSTPNGSYASVDGKGAGYTSSLTKILEGKGVTVQTNTKATELVVEDNVVVGVKVTGEAGEEVIKAKTVILATGGYGYNLDMIGEEIPECKDVYEGRVCSGCTGDGFVMAEAVGAEFYENPWIMVSTTMPSAEYNREANASGTLALGTSLAVDAEGKRFANEAASAYSAFGNYMIDNNIPMSYVLMNATEANQEVLNKGIELGEVVTAESVEALATALGMDAATLTATVDTYNTMCANGEDTEFGKAAASLVALDTTALYAVKYYPTSIGTIAGVKTNENNEVLREDGTVIEGLLAIGEMSNRQYYNYHYVGGASLGIYSTAGRLAGEYAAERAGK